jgi:hypothetical protein
MKYLLLISSLVLFSSSVVSGPFVTLLGGIAVTPDVYKATIEKIEFKQTSGAYTTFWSGSETMDIASVGVGSSVGSVAAGIVIPDGSYTHLRIQISKTIIAKGSVTWDQVDWEGNFVSSHSCRTSSDYITNTSNWLLGPSVFFTEGGADGGAATNQSIDYPVDNAESDTKIVYDHMSNGGLGLLSSDGSTLTSWNSNDNVASVTMEVELPTTLTIDSATKTYPTMSLDFRITNALEFAASVDRCTILLMPPVTTITIDGVSRSFEPTLMM